jgi:hypothetical protein
MFRYLRRIAAVLSLVFQPAAEDCVEGKALYAAAAQSCRPSVSTRSSNFSFRTRKIRKTAPLYIRLPTSHFTVALAGRIYCRCRAPSIELAVILHSAQVIGRNRALLRAIAATLMGWKSEKGDVCETKTRVQHGVGSAKN